MSTTRKNTRDFLLAVGEGTTNTIEAGEGDAKSIQKAVNAAAPSDKVQGLTDPVETATKEVSNPDAPVDEAKKKQKANIAEKAKDQEVAQVAHETSNVEPTTPDPAVQMPDSTGLPKKEVKAEEHGCEDDKKDGSEAVDPNKPVIQVLPSATAEGLSDEEKKSVGESITGLFTAAQIDLPESTKSQLITVFEAAVLSRVASGIDARAEQIKVAAESAANERVEKIKQAVTMHLDHAVESWVEENKLALQQATVVAAAESLFTATANLLGNHNISVGEGATVIAAKEAEIARRDAEINKLIADQASLKATVEGYQRNIAFTEVAEGLSSVQRDKLHNAAKTMACESVEDYKTKLVLLKGTIVGGNGKTTDVTTQAAETVTATSSTSGQTVWDEVMGIKFGK